MPDVDVGFLTAEERDQLADTLGVDERAIGEALVPYAAAGVEGAVINLSARSWRALGDYDPSGVALTAVVGLAGWFGWILHCDRRKLRDLKSSLVVNDSDG